MDSINKFLNIDDQLKKLENKKLVFTDQNSKNIFKSYLQDYNYSNFVLGLKNKLMFNPDKTYKKEFTSNNLRYLFDIDRNISTIIWKYFKSFELNLNSSIFKVLAEVIQQKTNTPYLACLSEKEFDEIFNNLNTIIYYEEKATIKKNMFIQEFFKNYDMNEWFDDVAQKNLDSENDKIINKIKNSWIATKAKGVPRKKRNWIYLQIFVLCSCFSFSQLIKFFKAVNKELQQKIISNFTKNIKSFNNSKITIESMIELLDIMSKYRNALAHNGNIMKFKIDVKENSSLFNIFKIRKNVLCKNKFHLNELIRIIEITIGLKEKNIFNEIKNSIQQKINTSNKKNEISILLLEIIENETNLKIIDKINLSS